MNSENRVTCQPVHPSLVPARTGHISVCFNKFMVVWGGYSNFNSFNEIYLPKEDLWVYNTDAAFWMSKTTTGNIPDGTSGAAACLIEADMYVFGGHQRNGNTNRLYKLNLSRLEWEHIVPAQDLLPSPRDKCVSWSYENRIYFFGGFGIPLKGYLSDSGDFHEDLSIVGLRRGWNNQLLVYDPRDNKWSNPKCKGSVPSSRAAHAAARVGNKVYIFGGRHIGMRVNDLHCLDLDTLAWNEIFISDSSVPCGRSWHSFTVISDRHIFLYGGFDQEDIPLNDSWVLDIKDLRWTQLDHFSGCNPHLWHTACCTVEGDVIVFGGCTNNILNDEEDTEHSNEALTFNLKAHSLLKISLEKVYSLKDRTQPNWSSLPQSLCNWLEVKDRINLLSQKSDSKTEVKDTGQSVGSTCVVS